MHKLLFAGCDISKDWLDLCLLGPDGRPSKKQFDNSPEGHQKLLAWLTATHTPVRIVMEATGNYSTTGAPSTWR